MQQISIDAQGRLLRVRVPQDDDGFRPKARRGTVEKFTIGSRMRLLRLLARLRVDPLNGYRSNVSFLTLTTKAMLHPRLAKRCLQIWLKRLRRSYPSVAAVWRMEYQKRGAPHFHLILFNTPWLKKEWIQESWGEVVREERPFTRIERVYNHRGMTSYAAKYCAKVSGQAPGFNIGTYVTAVKGLPEVEHTSPGRVWGVYNRARLPFDRVLACDLVVGGAWAHIRAYCRMFWRWLPDDNDYGFTVFCDDPYHALAHIRRLNCLYDS